MKKAYHSLTTVMRTLNLSAEEALCLISCGQMTPGILVENIRTHAIAISNNTREASYVSGLFHLTPRQCSRVLRIGHNTLFYLSAQGNTVISLPQPLTVQLSDLIVTNDDYEWIATFYPAPEDPTPTPLMSPREAHTSSKPNAIFEPPVQPL